MKSTMMAPPKFVAPRVAPITALRGSCVSPVTTEGPFINEKRVRVPGANAALSAEEVLMLRLACGLAGVELKPENSARVAEIARYIRE